MISVKVPVEGDGHTMDERKSVMSQNLRVGDHVIHSTCRDWGQGVIVAISASQVEVRFLDAKPALRKLTIATPLQLVSEVEIDPRLRDPVAEKLTEDSLWRMILNVLEEEAVRCRARGLEQLIIRTKVEGRENLVAIGDTQVTRRSRQNDDKWGDPRPIKKSEFWLLAKLAVDKGEHVLEDTPSSGRFGCFGCAILDMLPMFECLPSSDGRRQRIRYLSSTSRP